MHLLDLIVGPYIVHNMTVNLTIGSFPVPTLVTSVNNWLVIQQKIDESTDFSRYWVDYRNGFGTYNLNYWFGLEKVYQLTKSSSYKLRIEFQFLNGTWLSAEYDTFYLDKESAKYVLHVSGYSGDSGDVLNAADPGRVHNGMPFSTQDSDNDNDPYDNCVSSVGDGGGFWYNDCSWIRLNGIIGAESFCVFTDVTPGIAEAELLSVSRMMMKI